MKVGVAIPAYNALLHIERCLTTLQAQTYPVSIYICDDASDDGMGQFLDDRKDWYTKIRHNQRRMGWPVALNTAARMAIDDGCEAIFVMNADDFLRIDCIEKCVEAIDGNDFVIVYGQQIGGANVVQVPLAENVDYPALFGETCPFSNEALIWSSIWESVGGYSLDVTMPGSFGFKEDWDFWIKVFKIKPRKYAVVREPVYYYVMHPGQLHEKGLARHDEARELIFNKHARPPREIHGNA